MSDAPAPSATAVRAAVRAGVPGRLRVAGALLAAVGLALGLGLTLPDASLPTAHAAACDGVTVRVERGGSVTERCARGAPRNGLFALEAAGFAYTEVSGQPGMVCSIQGHPQRCEGTPPVDAYWSYWHADAGATSWTYASRGGASRTPEPGSHDAWVFGAGAPPSGPPPAPAPPPPASGGSGGSGGAGGSGGSGSSGGDGGAGGDAGAGTKGSTGKGSNGGATGGASGSSNGGSAAGTSAGGAGERDGGSTSRAQPPASGDRSGNAATTEAGGSGSAGDDGGEAEPVQDTDGDAAEGEDRDAAATGDGRGATGDTDRATEGRDLPTPRDEATPRPLAGEVTVSAPGDGGRGAAGLITAGGLVAGLGAAAVLRTRSRRGELET